MKSFSSCLSKAEVVLPAFHQPSIRDSRTAIARHGYSHDGRLPPQRLAVRQRGVSKFLIYNPLSSHSTRMVVPTSVLLSIVKEPPVSSDFSFMAVSSRFWTLSVPALFIRKTPLRPSRWGLSRSSPAKYNLWSADSFYRDPVVSRMLTFQQHSPISIMHTVCRLDSISIRYLQGQKGEWNSSYWQVALQACSIPLRLAQLDTDCSSALKRRNGYFLYPLSILPKYPLTLQS